MKVSSKGHYGLLALSELVASYKGQQAVQVKEIARKQHIPLQFLGQIMAALRRGHLVQAERGPAGGYRLARSPETITVKEVLMVLEGPAVGFELKAQGRRGGMSPVTQRLIEVWAHAIREMEKVLDETTLADLCKPDASALMYYI